MADSGTEDPETKAMGEKLLRRAKEISGETQEAVECKNKRMTQAEQEEFDGFATALTEANAEIARLRKKVQWLQRQGNKYRLKIKDLGAELHHKNQCLERAKDEKEEDLHRQILDLKKKVRDWEDLYNRDNAPRLKAKCKEYEETIANLILQQEKVAPPAELLECSQCLGVLQATRLDCSSILRVDPCHCTESVSESNQDKVAQEHGVGSISSYSVGGETVVEGNTESVEVKLLRQIAQDVGDVRDKLCGRLQPSTRKGRK